MNQVRFFLFIAFLACCSIATSAQVCKLVCPANMIVKTDSSREGAIVNFPVTATTGDCGVVTYSRASGSFFRIGSHSMVVTAADGQKCSFTITVADNEPPVLSAVTLSSKRIWPATNKMKRVGVYYTASDNADEVTTVLSVSSNDTESATKDCEVINNHLVRLKAARLPGGEPRIYTITVSTSDMSGNTTRRMTSIVVSKKMVAEDVVMY